MASKVFTVDGIGEITVYKRRSTHRINLRLVGGQIRVTQPAWLPYAAGVKFAESNSAWITQQQKNKPLAILVDGTRIGKTRLLRFEQGATLRTRITTDTLMVYVPPHLTSNSAQVQLATKQAIKRMLKKDAEEILPKRLEACAQKYGFNYTSVHCKSMRTRWGSCNNRKEITLNIYLLLTPWELIDYVLIHELVHTQHLHHGPEFWKAVTKIMPDYKDRRRQLKIIQHAIAPLQ